MHRGSPCPLKLPTFLREYDEIARRCAAEGLDHIRLRASGLWNFRHVNEGHDPEFLNVFDTLISGQVAS
jgi:hypothetical protein